MDISSSGFGSGSEDDFDSPKKAKYSVSEKDQDPAHDNKKYPYVQKNPNEKPVKGVEFNPVVICTFVQNDGTKCLKEMKRAGVWNHYQRNHVDEETIRRKKADDLLSAAKSRQEKSITDKTTFFILSQKKDNKPHTFPILPIGTEPVGDQANIIAEIDPIVARKWEESQEPVDNSIVHGTVICQFIPPADDPNIDIYKFMELYKNNPEYEAKWFYDVSSETIGPCPPTHLKKNSSSEVTRLALVEGYSTFVLRIKFGDGTTTSKLVNSDAALNWQYQYCVLAQHKRIHGVGGGGRMKMTLLNTKLIQKLNHVSVVSPPKNDQLMNIAVHGIQVFFPVQGFEENIWERFVFPSTTTYSPAKQKATSLIV